MHRAAFLVADATVFEAKTPAWLAALILVLPRSSTDIVCYNATSPRKQRRTRLPIYSPKGLLQEISALTLCNPKPPISNAHYLGIDTADMENAHKTKHLAISPRSS